MLSGSSNFSSEINKFVAQVPPAIQALTGVDLSDVRNNYSKPQNNPKNWLLNKSLIWYSFIHPSVRFSLSFPVSYWIKNQKVLRKIPGAKWRREQPGTQLAEWIMYSSSKQNKKTKWPKTRKTKMKSTNTLNSWTGFLTLQFLPVKIKNTNKKKIEIFNSKKKFKNYFFCLYLCIPLFVLFCYHNCPQLRCLTLPAVCFIVQFLSLYQCQGFSV